MDSGQTRELARLRLVVLSEFDVDAGSDARAQIAEFVTCGNGVARIVKQLLPLVIR